MEVGDLAVVDAEIETFAAAAIRLHQPRAQAQSLIHRCARRLLAGDFDEAERALGEAAEFAGLLEEDQILGMRLAGLAFVMREMQGRLEELEGAVHQFADAQPAMPAWRCALLCVYLQTGRDRELRREYTRLAQNRFASIPRDNLWLPALAFLTEACFRIGDEAGASELRTLLVPYAGRNIVTPDVAYIGPVDRYLGLAAATAGDTAEAASWFRSARDLATAMRARPTVARIAIDEAEALRPGAPARSAELAAEAAAEADALGLDRLAERARVLTGSLVAADSGPREGMAARLRRRGEMWEVAGGGPAFHLKNSKGLRYLARLVASPGHELHALDLAGGVAPEPKRGVPVAAGLSVRGGEGAGPMLDAQAKAEYLRRIADLEEEIEEAESFNDPERGTRARAELDFVSRELSAAVGLGGRDRPVGAGAERARVSVTRALRSAVDRIAEHDPQLGHHLRTCVRTGTFCAYDPGPDPPVWELDARG
jgi:hypothetical protein